MAQSKPGMPPHTTTSARILPSHFPVTFHLAQCAQKTAWMYHGGGLDLCNEFFAKHRMSGSAAIPAPRWGMVPEGDQNRSRSSGIEDAHWWPWRSGSPAARCCSAADLGWRHLSGLERGTIDAAEFVGPYDDEKLGFSKVAPFYYYPGWWDGGPIIHVMINIDRWNALPRIYKAAVNAAAAQTYVDVLGKYDARNPAAVRRLVRGWGAASAVQPGAHGGCSQGVE